MNNSEIKSIVIGIMLVIAAGLAIKLIASGLIALGLYCATAKLVASLIVGLTGLVLFSKFGSSEAFQNFKAFWTRATQTSRAFSNF